MNTAEIGARPYGGRWWRRSDSGAIELYNPANQSWEAWDGRMFGAYPPPDMFESGEDFEDPAPNAGRPGALRILKISVVLFALAGALDLFSTLYFQLEVSQVVSESDVDLARSIQTVGYVASTTWQLAVAAMVATTCFVVYRYIQLRTGDR